MVNHITWKNISNLVSNGSYKEALSHYAQAHSTSIHPNKFTFPFLLKSCKELKSIPQTQQIHTHIIKFGFMSNKYAATALIDAYVKLQLFGDALKVFDEIPNPTLPSFNAVIAGFSRHGRCEESVRSFRLLAYEGLPPNSVTIASLLPACRMVEQGLQLHGLSIKMGHHSDCYVATALITMYANCSELGLARKVFELIDEKKIQSYNAVVSGFLRNGEDYMALNLIRKMCISLNKKPNPTTLLSVLSVCSNLSACSLGKQVHCYLLRSDMNHDVKLGTALVDMYSKSGIVKWAYRVFMSMENRNLVTWNAMISGFLVHGHLNIALELIHKLKIEGMKPDTVALNLMIIGLSQQGKIAEAFASFKEMQSDGMVRPSLESVTSLLHSCSYALDLRQGKEIYAHVVRTRKDFDDVVFQTTMIHLCMRCGDCSYARRVFDMYGKKSTDPTIWNALISGYGRNGENELALQLFNEMLELNVKPNSATFLSVLSICGHSGQVKKGCDIFEKMSSTYDINPTAEHFGCMVDLLARAGKLFEARDLARKLDNPPSSVYYSLLGACECYSNAEIGEEMAERLCKLDPSSPTPLVSLSNIYAGENRWNDVERLRKMMANRGLYKVPGYSWMDEKAELQIT
ncbi:pentatricopeptide repeat-containing protein At2g02750-like [Ananas comosus]|uniref:Pentatricopeptide repeat-containing protein At2g02750-like n=2 Tax=Ananas comosus TaxID=4615 RepID=A0A6P5EMN9_ANACO|nr:pentatricopeptide repeat-containing protein At2g02750-like [Ananas comosus]XP_020088286.1 pentatricopeptide repeat-containing protein At2g02750-like [Ananas comosus]